MILNSEQMNAFLLRSRTTQRCPLSPFLSNTVLEVLPNAIRKKNKVRLKKGIQTRKEVELSLFIDKIIMHVENPQEATKKLLGLINELSKVVDTAGSIYKI